MVLAVFPDSRSIAAMVIVDGGIVGDRPWWLTAGAAGATLASLWGLTTV